MAKQDVLDAINATIVPNNIKGITAESLNNVLTMMAENTSEGGSGDGALRIIVPDMMLLGPEVLIVGELSPASWEEMKLLIEQEGVDSSEYDAVVKASFEHNANVAQQILEKGKAGQGVSAVLDQTPYFPASINASLQMSPEMAEIVEEFVMYAVQPAALYMQYMNATSEGEAMVGGDVFGCVLAPVGNTDFDRMSTAYPSNMLIFLNLDGSLTFTQIEEEEQPSSGSGVVTFYVDATGGELSSEYKSKNVEAYNAYKHGTLASIVAIMNGEPVSTITPISISQNENNITLGSLQGSNDGLSLMVAIINSDGSVTLP